jgi:hypothetical protein
VAERPEAALFAPLLAGLLSDPALRAAVATSQHDAVHDHTWQAYTARFTAELGARELL